MKAQIVEQIELFSEAELESLEYLPEELEALEEQRVPDLDSISFEDIAEELEAYFEGDMEGAGLEARGGRPGRPGGGGGHHGGGGQRPSRFEYDQIRDIKSRITAGRAATQYLNRGGRGGTRLPPARRGQEYREYDLGQARGGGRGKHRLVVLIGSNGKSIVKIYYTDNHYTYFTRLS